MPHTAPAQPGTTRQAATRIGTRTLLACGALGAPLFIIAIAIQMLARDGFDPRLHPLSLLSTGGPGWIQITNFIIVGALFFGCAVGMSRVLHLGPASTWGPRLFGAFGVSLIWSGAFVADPYRGFPPGTAEPDQASWHGMLHTIGPTMAYLVLFVACLVFARRFSALRQRSWMWYSIATAVVSMGLANAGLAADDFRIVLTGGIAIWLWASATALHLLRHDERR